MYLMYVWGHSYEFYNEDNWDLIESSCEFAGNRDDIWYVSNIQIVDYMNACRSPKFSASGDFAYNPSAQPVWLSVHGAAVEIPGGTQAEPPA